MNKANLYVLVAESFHRFC